MKIRIYRIPSGEVFVDTPSLKYQELGIEQCPHPGMFRNGEPFEMEVVESDDLEVLVQGKNDGGSSQFYYDGGVLKHDHTWDELVMDPILIRDRHKATLNLELDEELAKEEPDLVVVARKDRELTKVDKLSDLELYTIALGKLKKENKKPKIQVKLRKKLGLE